jgi:hypothetical protein
MNKVRKAVDRRPDLHPLPDPCGPGTDMPATSWASGRRNRHLPLYEVEDGVVRHTADQGYRSGRPRKPVREYLPGSRFALSSRRTSSTSAKVDEMWSGRSRALFRSGRKAPAAVVSDGSGGSAAWPPRITAGSEAPLLLTHACAQVRWPFGLETPCSARRVGHDTSTAMDCGSPTRCCPYRRRARRRTGAWEPKPSSSSSRRAPAAARTRWRG